MRLFALRVGLSALALGSFSVPSAAAEWSQVTKVVSVTAIQGLKVLRLQINPIDSNPGGCDATADFIDVQTDERKDHSHDRHSDGDRDSEEQRRSEAHRLMLNAIQLAYLTGRNIRFLLREDRCSTAGTSLRLRVAVGVQVSN